MGASIDMDYDESGLLRLAYSEHYNQRSVVKEFLKSNRPDVVEDILYDWLEKNEDRLHQISDEVIKLESLESLESTESK